MTDLKVGDRIFHDGKPVELLYKAAAHWNMQIWRVKDIFADQPKEYDEVFEPNDRISYVHSRHA